MFLSLFINRFMNILNEIANHVVKVFEGDNWTEVSIADTISDVSFFEASTVTQASQNTIASLLHHLHYWNGIMMQRINGINPSVPESNGYDVILENNSDWNDLKEKTHKSFLALANAIKKFLEGKLKDTYAEGKSSYYKISRELLSTHIITWGKWLL